MTDIPHWYDKCLSDKLNLPDNNYLQTQITLQYTTCYKFLKNTNMFNKYQNEKTIDNKKLKQLENLLIKEAKHNKIKTINTKINKLKSNVGKTTICKKITLYPNDEQKIILHKWFNEGYMKRKLDIFNELYGDNIKPCPYDILTDEVRIFCSNLKSCVTNLKNNNVNHFEIKHKQKN